MPIVEKAKAVYEAAKTFRVNCLEKDGSLFFDDTKVWTTANLKTLKEHFNVTDGSTPHSRGAMRSGRLPGCASTTRPSHGVSSSLWGSRGVSSRITAESRDEP